MKHDSEIIIRDVISQQLHYLTWLLQDIYYGGAQVTPNIPTGTPFDQSPLAESIRLICRAANGQMPISDPDAKTISQAIQSVCERLFSAPATGEYIIPKSFWSSSLGRAISDAREWLRGDDYALTVSEAARELFGDDDKKHLMAIGRLIDSGALEAWIDPDANPRRARRVSRTSVERHKKSQAN